ncbi:MAG: CHRD domain-containing protein [Candidatus Eiseniibacteriota bacterium]|jgi:CHRD domain-containing protein
MNSYEQTMAVIVIRIGIVIALITTLIPPFLVNALGQKFFATLSGENEIPPNNSSARGWVWLENLGDSIEYTINVTKMDKVMAAHLHTGAVGRNGDPIVTLFHAGPTELINGTLTRGNITSSEFQGPMSGKSIEDLLNIMTQGKTYVNIHTGSFPDGELRGQIATNNYTSMAYNKGNLSS